MANAPSTLNWLARQWEAAVAGAIFSGIVGDSQHGYGYHRSYNEVARRGDYSCKLAGDRLNIDPNAACAIDMSHTPAVQREITRRFYNSWKDANDLRLNHVREVIGTLDGRNVIYMDTQSGTQGSADNSHLWHVHVGGLRSNMMTQHAMNAILSIVRGESWAQYAATHLDDPFVHGSADIVHVSAGTHLDPFLRQYGLGYDQFFGLNPGVKVLVANKYGWTGPGNPVGRDPVSEVWAFPNDCDVRIR